jgi:hypothetical protein
MVLAAGCPGACGVGSAVIGHAFATGRVARGLAAMAMAGTWLAGFLGWIWATGATTILAQERLWAVPSFPPMPPRSLAELAQWPKLLMLLPRFPWEGPFLLGPSVIMFMSMLLVLVLVMGLAALWRKDRWIFLMLMLPMGLTIVVAMLELYPLTPRTLHFLLPLMALAAALALSWAWQWPRDLRVPGTALILVVVLPLTMYTALAAARPFPREELRRVLHHVAERHRPGDVIWLYSSARLTFLYYARTLAPDVWQGAEIVGESGHDLAAQLAELRRLGGRARVWLVFSHVLKSPIDEERFLIFILDAAGERLDRILVPGASAHLYDLRALPAAPGGARPAS